MGGERVTHSHWEKRQDKEMQVEDVMRVLGVISSPGRKNKTQVCQLAENAKEGQTCPWGEKARGLGEDAWGRCVLRQTTETPRQVSSRRQSGPIGVSA